MKRLLRFLLEMAGTAGAFVYASQIGPGLAFVVGFCWCLCLMATGWPSLGDGLWAWWADRKATRRA